jgi:dynein assembly factor 3
MNIYYHEKNKELICRLLLLLEIANFDALNFRERTELFLDIFGNSMIRDKSQRYIDSLLPILKNFVSDTKSETCLEKIIDLSEIKFKERDELMDILSS